DPQRDAAREDADAGAGRRALADGRVPLGLRRPDERRALGRERPAEARGKSRPGRRPGAPLRLRRAGPLRPRPRQRGAPRGPRGAGDQAHVPDASRRPWIRVRVVGLRGRPEVPGRVARGEEGALDVLFRQETLDGIRRGSVTLAFRRWLRPSVKSGGTLL